MPLHQVAASHFQKGTKALANFNVNRAARKAAREQAKLEAIERRVSRNERIAINSAKRLNPHSAERLVQLSKLNFDNNGIAEAVSSSELKSMLDTINKFDVKDSEFRGYFKKDIEAMENLCFIASEYSDKSIREIALNILNTVIKTDKQDYLTFSQADKKNLENFKAILSSNPESNLIERNQRVAIFLSEIAIQDNGLTMREKLDVFFTKLENGLGGEEGYALVKQLEKGNIAQDLTLFLNKPHEVLDGLRNPEKVYGEDVANQFYADQPQLDEVARILSRVARTIFIEEAPADLDPVWVEAAANLIEYTTDPKGIASAQKAFVDLFNERFEQEQTLKFQSEDLISLYNKLNTARKSGNNSVVFSSGSLEKQELLKVMDADDKKRLLLSNSDKWLGTLNPNNVKNVLNDLISKGKLDGYRDPSSGNFIVPVKDPATSFVRSVDLASATQEEKNMFLQEFLMKEVNNFNVTDMDSILEQAGIGDTGWTTVDDLLKERDVTVNVTDSLLRTVLAEKDSILEQYDQVHEKDLIHNLTLLSQVSFTLSIPLKDQNLGEGGFGSVFTRNLFSVAEGETEIAFMKYFALDSFDNASDEPSSSLDSGNSLVKMIRERAELKAGTASLRQNIDAAEKQIVELSDNFTDRTDLAFSNIDQVQVTEWFAFLNIQDVLKDYEDLGINSSAAKSLVHHQKQYQEFSSEIQDKASLIDLSSVSNPSLINDIKELTKPVTSTSVINERQLSRIYVKLREEARLNPDQAGILLELSKDIKKKILLNRKMSTDFIQMLQDDKQYQEANGVRTGALDRARIVLAEHLAPANRANFNAFMDRMEAIDLKPVIEARENNRKQLEDTFITIDKADSSLKTSKLYQDEFNKLRAKVTESYLEDFDVLQMSLATNDSGTFNVFKDSMQQSLESRGLQSNSTAQNINIVKSQSHDRSFKDTIMYYLSSQFLAFIEFGAQLISGKNQNGGLVHNG